MNRPETKTIQVAVGIIRRAGKVLIARRPDHVHQGGLWEFPGGKIQPDESIQQALARELREELGIQIDPRTVHPLFAIDWDYPEKRVCLQISLVDQFLGEPKGVEGQAVLWIDACDLGNYPFPEANKPIIDWLMSPENR